jgi:hypothetical protein
MALPKLEHLHDFFIFSLKNIMFSNFQKDIRKKKVHLQYWQCQDSGKCQRRRGSQQRLPTCGAIQCDLLGIPAKQ